MIMTHNRLWFLFWWALYLINVGQTLKKGQIYLEYIQHTIYGMIIGLLANIYSFCFKFEMCINPKKHENIKCFFSFI